MMKFPPSTVRRVRATLSLKRLALAMSAAFSLSFTVAAASGWLASQSQPKQHPTQLIAEGGQWGNKGGRSLS